MSIPNPTTMRDDHAPWNKGRLMGQKRPLRPRDVWTVRGFRVIEAGSGPRALELAREGLHFDGLVTDYAMPGMSGAALATQLRETKPRLPVLVITGYAVLTDSNVNGLPRLAKPIMRARYGLHTLRHFFATYMIERDVAPKRLQGMLGHSSLVMTMDTYGHLFENLESDQPLMAAADSALIGERA